MTVININNLLENYRSVIEKLSNKMRLKKAILRKWQCFLPHYLLWYLHNFGLRYNSFVKIIHKNAVAIIAVTQFSVHKFKERGT